MGNVVELRETVKTLLDTNVLDPYPATLTRKGNHFISESDGINFKRKDTFPKGEVRVEQNPTIISGFGTKGHGEYSASVDIIYYLGEKDKYDDAGTIYKGKDLIRYILKACQDTVLNNRFKDYYLKRTSFSQPYVEPVLMMEGGFAYNYGVISIMFYWTEKYGN